MNLVVAKGVGRREVLLQDYLGRGIGGMSNN